MTDAEVVPLNSFNRFAYLHARKPRADHLGQPLQVLYGRRPVTQVGTQLSIAAISEVAARCVFVRVVGTNRRWSAGMHTKASNMLPSPSRLATWARVGRRNKRALLLSCLVFSRI